MVLPVYFLLKLQTPAGNYGSVGFMLLAALTDAYDGRLARRLGQRTDLGRILDPIADKIAMAVITIVLVATRDLPLWFVFIVVGRDLTILILGFFLVVRTRVVVESNMLGKVTINALALTVVSYTLDWSAVKPISLGITVVLTVASSVSYIYKMVEMSRRVEDK